jgi:hypothetical protein
MKNSRGLMKKKIELAQAVKDNFDGARVRTGIASDVVIQLANILGRLARV